MTKGQGQRDAKTDTAASAERSNEGGDAAAVIVGNVPSGRKMPVVLFSVVWVAWIVFLICMMAM